jgi:outer membrane biosynthesis protein TonB
MMSRLVGFETVAVGDLFSKIDKHQSTWEVIELVTPTGHYPHARLACVDRPTDRRMIAIAALNDKRMYLDAGKSPRFEAEDLPIDEPHVDLPPVKSARQAEPPKAETKAEVQPEEPAPEKAARIAAPPEPAKEPVKVTPEPRRKSSMRAVFDQLEHDPQAA